MKTPRPPRPATPSNHSGKEAASLRQVRPRVPSRGPGVLRYAALVDATEALLHEQSADEVGLYQIAERAGVPPASVYYFFPTKEAAFLALTRRYLDRFGTISEQPIPTSAAKSWQALLSHHLRLMMGLYNAHVPALKLILGGFGGESVKQADREFMEQAAAGLHQRYDAMFHLPFLRHPERTFLLMLEITDAIWAVSYIRHGTITDEYFQEALAATTGYFRTFLPEHLEPRQAADGPVAGLGKRAL